MRLRSPVVLLALFAAACIAPAAQTRFLLPSVALVWRTDVEPLVRKGATPAVTEAADRLAAALTANDPRAVNLAEWSDVLRPAGELAIVAMVNAGEIGPNGAGSFRETLRQFGEKLTDAVTPTNPMVPR
jgi:hypothetical protein